ncbi:MAG: SPFH domain-containing protein [Planctomycetota bacterium]|jgi:regulator of protease activity HflC (stomatin/prohibitin superfamily)
MPDADDNNIDPIDPIEPSGPERPYEEEPMDVETPRRAASAQFIVDSEAGAITSLREAMDPAHQSLTDALRMSFRVLQIVILVLVVLFIFSGWKKVKVGQTGVLTVWGEIVEVKGSKALTDGYKFSRWPYPAGEFILFQERNLAVDLGTSFWPAIRPNQTFEQAVSQASVNDRLRPGRDGSVITRDAELAHLQLTARYEIADPVGFVERVQVLGDDADRIVRLALQRAVVHSGAGADVDEITERSELFAADISRSAQEMLDAMGSGIFLRSIDLPRTSAPLAIRKTMEDLQQTNVRVEESFERARQTANETLTTVAGPQHPELWALIESYQVAAEGGDDALAEQRLAEIGSLLDTQQSGGVARIINAARSYRSLIESTLGSDARYFASLLPAYRQQPEMVVKRLWLESYANVLGGDEAEIIYAPRDLATMQLAFRGLDSVADRRRERAMDRREQQTNLSALNELGIVARRAQDIQTSGPGRQLRVDEGEGGTTVRSLAPR